MLKRLFRLFRYYRLTDKHHRMVKLMAAAGSVEYVGRKRVR